MVVGAPPLEDQADRREIPLLIVWRGHSCPRWATKSWSANVRPTSIISTSPVKLYNDAARFDTKKCFTHGGDMCRLKILLAIAVSLVFAVSFAAAQEQASHEKAAPKMAHKKAAISDAQYTAEALSAGPKSIAKDAGVMRMDESGKPRTLRESKNGFTCMVIGGNKMCNDANSMEFFSAMMNHQTPTDKLGVSYMLRGDDGASNTDPTATKKTADDHWVVTGPHIMLTGTPAKSLGYTEAPDPDPTKPYMMWAGTPYEHAMVPIAAGSASAKPAMAKDEMKK